ncbi:hypothetical protein BDW02DRAFT_581667 [Decorospora gaudefroyi]|uniref:Uncharacterized protein n=1 Tax=Decorospora gaudefroyi TaxID=184978 RepID=A0A6A5K3T8_9PLEO|nr:hypothetical protein BDW02DRAFT_581667 [Decorospora gaudefroyi]
MFPSKHMLVCPELGQTQKLPQYACVPCFFFDRKDETWFYNTLAKPTPGLACIPRYHPPAGDFFERLPNELIHEIIAYLVPHEDDVPRSPKAVMEDILALGLSSARLWSNVLYFIHRCYQKRNLDNWAGKKIVFQAHHSKITAAQAKHYCLDVEESPGYPHDRKYWSSVERRGWKPFKSQPKIHWRDIVHSPKFKLLDARGRAEVMQDLSQMYLYSRHRVWVLRNLTTRQIVRSDQLQEPKIAAPDWEPMPPSHATQAHHPTLKRLWDSLRQDWKGTVREKLHHAESPQPLTLANIFLILASSAERPHQGNSPYATDLLTFGNGPWAGCAFDLVTLKEHKKSIRSGPSAQLQQTNPWVNVSKEVVADIANLCFCIRKHQGFYGLQPVPHEHWEKTAATRSLHHRWIEQCPPRPWIDESMYESIKMLAEEKETVTVMDRLPKLELRDLMEWIDDSMYKLRHNMEETVTVAYRPLRLELRYLKYKLIRNKKPAKKEETVMARVADRPPRLELRYLME